MSYAEVVVRVPLASPPTLSRRGGAEAEIPAPYARLDQTFTYEVPPALRDSLVPGQMVWVPFGARRLQGIVVGLSETTTLAGTRLIEEIVAPRPWLSPARIELARWMSHRYLAPLSECIWLQLPPGIQEKIETLYEIPNSPADISAAASTGRGKIQISNHKIQDSLSDRQREVLARVESKGRAVRLPAHLRATAETLVERGYLVKRTHVKPPAARPKRIQAVRLAAGPEEVTRALAGLSPRAARVRTVADFLQAQSGPVWISAVYAATGATRRDLEKLEEAGLVRLETAEALRDPLANRKFVIEPPPALTPEQARAFEEIRAGLETQSACAYLLHGVTGSGKTEIYLRAIQEVLDRGKQALALVPEIALTPQTIRRFGARFGERLGVIHSDLSPGERYDTWRRARDGGLDVIVGPRSALFAPLPRLGLIVIDEEHEPSYKQEDEHIHLPRYHAREAALELARLHRATVILGSATPDVETYYRAQEGEFRLLELPQRILAHETTGAPARYQDLPPVQVVDLRAELRADNTSVFSRALASEMERVLQAGEQVILFLNRRGAATSVVCRTCGRAVKCPRCNTPFTLHQSTRGGAPENAPPGAQELVCHHCGKRGRVPRVCPECGSARVRPLGLGTEKLEQAVRERFPTARPLRWDWDVTRGKQAHEKILEAFVRGEADVLIGTQMIAKGLDLPRVTLVGVVNADTGLHLPDFRASERTFQLLTQVAGRAGRSALGGQAIIQTYYPEHYAIAAAAQHDYGGFYRREIEFRRESAYPPIRPLIRLVLAAANEAQAREGSARLAGALLDLIRRRGLMDVELTGPAPAFYARLRGQYRFQLLLRGRDAPGLLATFPLPRGWSVDVDPVNLL